MPGGRLRRLARLFFSSLLLLVAVPLGALGSVGGFFGAAFVTSSVPLLALAGALALLLSTGTLSWLACRGLFRHGATLRRWLPLGLAGGTLLLVGVAAGLLVFRPMDVAYVPKEPTDRTRYWELPTGSRLAYELTPARGTPEAAPVVMLHGGPGAPGDLSPDRVDLALADAGFDVYRYDQVGAGLSERLGDPSRYTVARHVADLEAVREEIGAESLVLVGGSWGGTLAAHYTAAHPGRVEKVMVDSPGAIWVPAFAEGGISRGPEDEIIGEAVTVRFLAVLALQEIDPRAAANLVPDREMSAFFQPLIGRIIASDVAGCDAQGGAVDPPDRPRIPEGFGYYANVATVESVEQSADPRPALGSVRTPVLVVRAECDRLRWEVTREYREVFPNATLVVAEGASHSVRASRPGLSADLLRAFALEEPLPLEPYRSDETPG